MKCVSAPQNAFLSQRVSCHCQSSIAVVWGIASLLSKEQGLNFQVSVVYCVSDISCAQDAKALVSRVRVVFSGDIGSR